MNQLDQTIEDLKFCVETLGMNDQQVEEYLNITSEFGVRPEYFSNEFIFLTGCLLYTSPSPRDLSTSRMPSSA